MSKYSVTNRKKLRKTCKITPVKITHNKSVSLSHLRILDMLGSSQLIRNKTKKIFGIFRAVVLTGSKPMYPLSYVHLSYLF
jgi:hypothetical protein